MFTSEITETAICVVCETEVLMEKRILAYRRYMDELLRKREAEGGMDEEEMEALKREHLVQLGFFQHERLIHLIVTVTFAVAELLSLMMTMLSEELFPIILTILVLILLLPYIRHYYILENEVQRMYAQYDRIGQIAKKTGIS